MGGSLDAWFGQEERGPELNLGVKPLSDNVMQRIENSGYSSFIARGENNWMFSCGTGFNVELYRKP